MAERHCIGTVWAVAMPRRCAAFGAEEKVGDMAAVAGLLPHLCVALGAYAVGGEAGLRGKGAAAACLAVAAMTHRHAHRSEGRRDGQACVRTCRHRWRAYQKKKTKEPNRQT